MEFITWIIFIGWAMMALVKNYDPIIFLADCIAIGLVCIANAIRHVFDRKYDQKLLQYFNERKE